MQARRVLPPDGFVHIPEQANPSSRFLPVSLNKALSLPEHIPFPELS